MCVGRRAGCQLSFLGDMAEQDEVLRLLKESATYLTVKNGQDFMPATLHTREGFVRNACDTNDPAFLHDILTTQLVIPSDLS